MIWDLLAAHPTESDPPPPSCRQTVWTTLTARQGLEAIRSNRDGLRGLGAGRYSLSLTEPA